VGQALPLSESEFAELIRSIEDGMQRIERVANQIIDHVSRSLKFLGPMAQQAADLLRRFADLMRKLFSEVGKYYTRWGVPWTLYHHGEAWTDDVGARAHRLASKADAGQLLVDDYWTGPAANAYIGVAGLQSKALNNIKAATDELDDVLLKVGGAILAFWVAIAGIILPFLVELGLALAAALGVITAPAAAAGAGFSTAKAVTLLVVVLGGSLTYVTALMTQMRDLDQRLHNSDGLPGGFWPKLTSDISNGRVHDHGKTIDWNVKS
jgi:hypothetical protein